MKMENHKLHKLLNLGSEDEAHQTSIFRSQWFRKFLLVSTLIYVFLVLVTTLSAQDSVCTPVFISGSLPNDQTSITGSFSVLAE